MTAPGISIRGLRKTFGSSQNGTVAIENLDLDIAAAEFVAVVGPSGCGKSTLMRMVVGLLPPTAGEIVVFGERVTGPVTASGIVFQQPTLLEWRTVLENVLFNIDMRGLNISDYRERAVKLLEAVDLAAFADKRPYELSGGMKQRVAIARALVHSPPLLLMDEPFGALDALTREQMRIDLEQIWLSSRTTVLFITHSIDEAVLLADRVVVMSPRPGRIEKILRIDIPRPRALAGRKDERFAAAVELITEIFLSRGVLHRSLT